MLSPKAEYVEFGLKKRVNERGCMSPFNLYEIWENQLIMY